MSIDNQTIDYDTLRSQQASHSAKIAAAIESLRRQSALRGPTLDQLDRYPAVREAWEAYLVIATLHGISSK